jgi:GAF domain-containing protein
MSSQLSAIDLSIGKSSAYEHFAAQLVELIDPENPVGTLANFSALLKDTFHWWWIGIYFNDGKELKVGPYQGPLACNSIAYNRGVCGHAYSTASTVIVPDVEEFPGHIACSTASKSEIVVPIIHEGQVLGVIDADSEFLNHFDDQDAAGLEKLATILVPAMLSLHLASASKI